MKFKKGMIIPFGLMCVFFAFQGVKWSLRSFDDLSRISGKINRIDSLDIRKKGFFYDRQYYLYLDKGYYKTTKKAAGSLRAGDQVDIYVRSPNELFSGLLPDANIILHLQHDKKVLIDYNKEQKVWYGIAGFLIFIGGYFIYLIRKQRRKDSVQVNL